MHTASSGKGNGVGLRAVWLCLPLEGRIERERERVDRLMQTAQSGGRSARTVGGLRCRGGLGGLGWGCDSSFLVNLGIRGSNASGQSDVAAVVDWFPALTRAAQGVVLTTFVEESAAGLR